MDESIFKGNKYTFKGENLVKIILTSYEKGSTLKWKSLLPTGNPFWKTVYSKRKEFSPKIKSLLKRGLI